MSAERSRELAEIFTRWLQRYLPPKHLQANPVALSDEIESLLSALLRFAPTQDYGPFVRLMLEELDYSLPTRTWPTKAEVATACMLLRKQQSAAALAGPSADTAAGSGLNALELTARRMAAGEPVAESALHRERAAALLAQDLIPAATLQRYQRGAFEARRATYGAEAAQAWYQEMIAPLPRAGDADSDAA